METVQDPKNQENALEESRQEEEVRVEDLSLTVTKVKDCRKDGIIGIEPTFIALKNEKSFLVCSSYKGLIVLENEVEVYSGKLPVGVQSTSKIVYAPPPHNCYFIIFETRLYRKNINDKPPYVFMHAPRGERFYGRLTYSKFLQRLVLSRDLENISVINPETKKIEIVMKKSIGYIHGRLRIIGDHDNRLLTVTYDGYVVLYSINHQQKRGVVAHHREELVEGRSEMPLHIGVCPKEDYVFVDFFSHEFNKTSRVVIFKLREDALAKIASIEVFNQNIERLISLEPSMYYGSHILLLGLGENEEMVEVFDYDTETQELRRLEDKRVCYREHEPLELHQLGNKFYYIGFSSKLMSLSLSN